MNKNAGISPGLRITVQIPDTIPNDILEKFDFYARLYGNKGLAVYALACKTIMEELSTESLRDQTLVEGEETNKESNSIQFLGL